MPIYDFTTPREYETQPFDDMLCNMIQNIPQSVDELLAAMVQHDTVNAAVSAKPRAEQSLVDSLEQLATKWSLSTTRLATKPSPTKQVEIGGSDSIPELSDQLMIIVEATSSKTVAPWLLFDSHLDTVSANNMTIDPFAANIKQGRLYGRGSCDTKGTGAAALWALKQYAELTHRPNHIVLLFSVDEEYNMTGIDSFLHNQLPQLRERFGGDPIVAIAGEPTMLRPVIAHNGVTRWRIDVTGIAAHSAAPYLGKSAISAMLKVMRLVEDQYIATLTEQHELTGQAICNITVIQGGTQVNILPGHCCIDIDRRLVPGEDADEEFKELDTLLNQVRNLDEEIRIELTCKRSAPSLPEAANIHALPRLQNVLTQIEMPKAPIGAPFATHAGDMARAGLPAIVWGPGEPYPAHTKDEWVELAAIRKGVEAYFELMRSL
jgi:acetylornithine deacetylase